MDLATHRFPIRKLMHLALLVGFVASAAACGGGSGTGTGSGGHVAGGGGGARAVTTGGTSGSGGLPTPGTGGGDTGGAPSTGGSGGQSGSGGVTAAGTGGDSSTAGSAGGGTQPGTGGHAGAGGSAGGEGGGGGAQPATGGRGGAGGPGGGTSELIHYYGRWNVLPDRAVTVNSGSHLTAQFTGTAITARFDISVNLASDMPTLAWQIDQDAWREADMAATVTLGTGLAAGTHTVTVMARALDENQSRWTPPLVSSITFLGFTVTGGTLQESPRPVRPKLEILGDSITEGVVVWSSHNGKSTQCWQNDGRIAYPTQTAQKLGAEWRQVGFGYLGILKTGDGGVPKANDSFNWIYKGVPRDSWQADMVVINEGTNDSAAAAATFRAGYATYLTTIRAAYPGARIACMRPFNGAQAAQIKAEVDASNAAGDSRVYYVDTTGWLGTGDFTDGLHPNSVGSGKAATALAAAITKIGLP